MIERLPGGAGYRWLSPGARLQDDRILTPVWQPGSIDKRLIIVHEDVRYAGFKWAENFWIEHELTNEVHRLPCGSAQRPLWII
jgi:hypothetical protein